MDGLEMRASTMAVQVWNRMIKVRIQSMVVLMERREENESQKFHFQTITICDYYDFDHPSNNILGK